MPESRTRQCLHSWVDGVERSPRQGFGDFRKVAVEWLNSLKVECVFTCSLSLKGRGVPLCHSQDEALGIQKDDNSIITTVNIKKERKEIMTKKNVKNLVTWSPSHLVTSTKPAFTLAEVLITLGIIGVVASMTIPTLVTNISNRQFETGAKKTESTLIQALMMMKANDALVGLGTTENFVGELQNYLKISKVCDNSHLDECYPEEFTANGEEYELSSMTTSEALGQNWGTNLNGFVLNNGTYFLTAYNPGCTNDDYRQCATFAYDLNSIDKNNNFTGTNGESDLGVFNAVFFKDENSGCTWSAIEEKCSGNTTTECFNSITSGACKTEEACTGLGSANVGDYTSVPYWDDGQCKIRQSVTDPT